MKKKKFKNTKIKNTPEEEFKTLLNEQLAMQKLAAGIVMGDCDFIFPAIFSKLRALVCTGTWTMKPLLQRVMKEQHFSLKFYSIEQCVSKQTLDRIILSKEWLPDTQEQFVKNVTLDDYLQEKIFYHPYKDMNLSRNDLILLFSNEKGAHFDPEIDKYANQLENLKITFLDSKISQKEIFMWDIYMLVDYHINALSTEYQFKQQVDSFANTTHLISKKQKRLNLLKNHYSPILRNNILSIELTGKRLCESCNGVKLNKTDEVTYRCLDCDKEMHL